MLFCDEKNFLFYLPFINTIFIKIKNGKPIRLPVFYEDHIIFSIHSYLFNFLSLEDFYKWFCKEKHQLLHNTFYTLQ